MLQSVSLSPTLLYLHQRDPSLKNPHMHFLAQTVARFPKWIQILFPSLSSLQTRGQLQKYAAF